MSQYFQGLNYSLANEDTKVEYDLLPEGVDSVFTVCGSGSRVLPLIAKNPKEITVVDLSPTQLALCRLRIAAAKNLSYEDFLYFLGYKKDGEVKRTELMSKLDLITEDQNLWKQNEADWVQSGFVYLGRWENHFMKLGRVYDALPGVDVTPLFESKNLEEQKRILRKHWHPRLFDLFTRVVLNEWVSNRLLYKGSFAGGKDKRTSDRTAAKLVSEEFSDLFESTWVKANFFLNMIFLGEIRYPEALPLEATEKTWSLLQSNETRIKYQSGNLLEIIKDRPHNFYSLSDTFSYLSPTDLENFLPSLPKGIHPGAKMVIRTFMRKPYFPINSSWQTDHEENLALAKKDCTRVYEIIVMKRL